MTNRLYLCFSLTLLAMGHVGTSAEADEPSLADELPRLPAVEAAEALSTFTLQHGFTLELVAGEPLVADPIDACFDEWGRMYVAEMHGYPYSAEVRQYQPEPLGKVDAGIIRRLEDTDGDGVFETSVVFADRLSWVTSVCCYDGGVFVLAPSKLLYLKDTDGNGRADIRRIIFTGFSRDNVQGLANNLKWGPDNRIYVASGTNDGDLMRDGEVLGSLRGADFCFDPKTFEVEFLTGGRQFGHSMDDWGNRFVCGNSNHIQHVVYERRDLEGNPGVSVPEVIRTIAAEGAAAPVFRTSPAEPWRIVRTRRRAADPEYSKRLPHTELVPTGFFTSATGVTIYRGDAYPKEYWGNAFIGDVGGNLVHRKSLTPDGATFIAKRTEEGVEFLTSTDTWFRPANFVNAPDGCLYILDMYRETIEHPRSIPDDIKAHVDLESGDDRGRIWRLTPSGFTFTAPPRLGDLSSAELVLHLASTNAWRRETAQRLLWERQNRSVIDDVRELAKTSKLAVGRRHALDVLEGLGAMETADVVRALSDDDPRMQVYALKLLSRQLNTPRGDRNLKNEQLTAQLEKLAEDPDPQVAFALAMTLKRLDGELRDKLWQQLASKVTITHDLRAALLMGATGDRVDLIRGLAAVSKDHASPLMLDLAETVGLSNDPKEASQVLAVVADQSCPDAIRPALLTALGRGLSRRGGSVGAVLETDGVDKTVRQQVEELFSQARNVAADVKRSDAEREQAIGLLALTDFSSAGPTLRELLTPQTSQRLQLAAIAALHQQTGTEPGALLIENWESFSPQCRKAAVDAMLSHQARTKELLLAMADGKVGPGDLEPADRQLLLNHPDDGIREEATRVLGQPASDDREEVIAQYESALDEAYDADQGRAVFKKLCSNCHRLGTEGHAVGPDLVSVKNKSARDLLIAILDPNRERQPNYASYTIVTVDGHVVTGIISAESAESVTLRRAEGKEETILREDIELLKSNGVSLMPANLEKELKPEQVAAMIALIRGE
ncbi:MAG: c-type cytochrome [Planctomycetaceae bacterium]|nr:c-type cytochrome [Planctomycetaceae bacterium]